MSELTQEGSDPRITTRRYFALVDEGALRAGDRVELLDGVIVAMAPQNPRHAAGTSRTDTALRRAIGDRAAVRVQMPLLLSEHSAPEPDLAVVAGADADYDVAHPTRALLVVEIADSSLAQDRISKARIYAAALIPEVWIINLRDDQLEVLREPVAASRSFRTITTLQRGECVELLSLPGARVAVDDLLPIKSERGSVRGEPVEP